MRFLRNYLICLFAILLSCSNNDNKINHVDFIGNHHDQIKNEKAAKWFEKGLWYVERNRYAYAKECFEHADELYPNCPTILNAIGACYMRLDSLDYSLDYYARSLAYDSSFISTYSNYGLCLNSAGRYKEAKKILSLGLKRNRDSLNLNYRSLHINLAYSYYSLKNTNLALRQLDSAKVSLKEGIIYNQIMSFKIKLLSESRMQIK